MLLEDTDRQFATWCMNPAMPKNSFLFVPYRGGTADSAVIGASPSDARSHAAVVSRQRRESKARYKAQLQLSDAKTTKPRVRRGSDEPIDSMSSPRSHTSDETQLLDRDDNTTAQPASVVKRRQRMRTMQFSWRAGSVGSDACLSNGWRADPFGNQDPFYGRIVDYYANIITPVNHPIYAIFDVTNVYTSFYLELLEDEDYMPAGLAMVGAVMQGLTQPENRMTEDVRYNHAKAVARLRGKLAVATSEKVNSADDITIITMLALASFSRLLGDTVAYKAHRENMSRMIASRGGLDNLGYGGLTKCVLMQWDQFWVFQTEATSMFPNARPEHHPVYPAIPLSDDLQDIFAKVPSGFQTLIVRGKISVELMETLSRAADVAEGGIEAITPGNMYQTRHQTNHDFIEACPCLGTVDGDKPNLEKQLTLALLLYCANAFTDARSSTSLYAAARMELTRLLLRGQNDWSIPPEEESAFWVCAVCVDSWRRADSSTQLLPYGVKLLPILQEQATLHSPEQVLQKFFCCKEFLYASKNYLAMPV